MNIRKIERDLTVLWENFRVEPKYMQMTLGVLRKMARERDDTKPYVLEFLKQNVNVGDDAVVSLSPNMIALCE